MATYDLEEQEKIDGLKSWWEVYGTLAIIIVATFVAGIFGTQAWKYYQKPCKSSLPGFLSLLDHMQTLKHLADNYHFALKM